MSQDFSVLLHTPTDGTDGDCTASLKIPGASVLGGFYPNLGISGSYLHVSTVFGLFNIHS